MDYKLSLVTFFLGLLLGHWLSIGRDKRKEFNEKALELNSKFYDYIEKDNDHFLPNIKDLTLFASYIPWRKRRLFINLVNQFNNSLSNDRKSKNIDPISGIPNIDPEYVSQTKVLVGKLRKYLKRT